MSVATQNWKDGSDGAAPDTLTTTAYGWYDGAVQASVTFDGDTGSGSNAPGVTTYYYDTRGLLASVHVADGRTRDVVFTNDVGGQAVRRDEADTNTAQGDPHEIWYRFAGRQMGYTGNNGTREMDYGSSITERMSRPPAYTGPFRDGTATSVAYADFTGSYDAINSYGQASAYGGYTARGGETLASIAAALWGDAALWYTLAEANPGLAADAPLAEGQTLTLPAGIIRSTHNAQTFKPYDPADIIGDTMPTTPKPPKGNKCGVVGAVLIAVVAVTVTIASAGAALSAVGAVKGGFMAATKAFLGVAGAANVGAGATIAADAFGGAVGSIASQGAGIAMGMQDKINWGGVALGGISGAIGGALGPNGIAGADGLFGGGVVQVALRGVVSNALTQGVGVATGLQSKFDFVGVAAAGVGALAGGALGSRLGIPGSAGAAIGQRLLTGTAGGLANAAARSLLTGTSFGDNLIAALPDIIAQTVGGAIELAASRQWSGTQTAALGSMPFGQDVQSDVPEYVITHEPWSAWDEFSYRWSQLGDSLRFQVPVIGDPANHRTMEQYRRAELNARPRGSILDGASAALKPIADAGKALVAMRSGMPYQVSAAFPEINATGQRLLTAGQGTLQLGQDVSAAYRGDLAASARLGDVAVQSAKALGRTGEQVFVHGVMGGDNYALGNGAGKALIIGGEIALTKRIGSITTSPLVAEGAAPLARTYRGGAYGRLSSEAGVIERHHAPPKSLDFTTEYSGPAIQMDYADHLLTSSHTRMGAQGALYRSELKDLIDAGNVRGAMAREVWDIRRAAVQGGGSASKYNRAVQEMLDYSYGKGWLKNDPDN
ncbi:LysM peptidoglycan-binding domain-containing protein [Sphingomonas sp. BT-65]|uniref:LysM peptidoglycan-binding domain-containing protein n=1 Tax=Sphingomonas sp. BT-65 TaxID=2989821 RepID=UPI0022355989|nr:LysM domain-containing protein [Sphingomonas sp. BT-65]MCW4463815.1 LysM peptidoglycan-binding domain-containing protein [Sphingomonas sp. BT-65]